MSREIRVHYQINDRRIPAILVNDQDMHNVDQIWEASGGHLSKSPAIFLSKPDAQLFLEMLSRKFGKPESSFKHINREGWWFTQQLAIEYARWISPEFSATVNFLAVKAAKALEEQGSPEWHEIRERGKEGHRAFSAVVDEFGPLMRHNRDVKHEYASAAIARGILGANPSEIRRRDGLSKKDQVWNRASKKQNAMRYFVLVMQEERLSAKLEQTRDPNVMLDVVENTTREVVNVNRPFLEGPR